MHRHIMIPNRGTSIAEINENNLSPIPIAIRSIFDDNLIYHSVLGFVSK